MDSVTSVVKKGNLVHYILEMYLFLEKNYMLKELGKFCSTNFWPLNVAKVGNTAKQKASTVAARFYVSFLLAKLAGRQITHLRPFGVS